MTITAYDKQYIEQRLVNVTEDINALISLCGGRQKFSPGDKDRVRYDYENLKSKLQGLAVHAFESDEGREFCIYSGLNIAARLTAKTTASPDEITKCLNEARSEVDYRLDKLLKW